MMHAYTVPGGNSKGDSRCTPPEIWKVALVAAGTLAFDLDPASNGFSTVPATYGWDGTAEDRDGLLLSWFGHVWLNFPFSCPDVWVQRALAEAATRATRSITILSPADSSTQWWHDLRRGCDAWSAWKGREHFPLPGQPKGSPGGGVQLSYIGPGVARWTKVMEHLGHTTFPGRSEHG